LRTFSLEFYPNLKTSDYLVCEDATEGLVMISSFSKGEPMKSLNKLVAAAAFVPVVAISSTAFAGSVGQLGNGDTYQVKNVTQNTSYSNNATAACGDTVEYSMELGNTGFGTLSDVTLKATLPSAGGTSTATATTNLGGTSGATDTASVSLPSGATQALVDGTTILYDGNGNVINTLPDTITNGVDIGVLNGSTTEFVNFKAKVSCPTPTPVPTPTPTPVTTVTTTSTPSTPAPTQLVNTGAGNVVGIFAAASAVSAAAYRFVVSRRLSRQ
jgi:hypothetical protein